MSVGGRCSWPPPSFWKCNGRAPCWTKAHDARRYFCLRLQANAASPAGTEHVLADQNDPALVQSGDQFHEGVDVSSNHAFARFHALNRRHRETRLICELPLIDTCERACSAHLSGSDHAIQTRDSSFDNSCSVHYLTYVKHECGACSSGARFERAWRCQ